MRILTNRADEQSFRRYRLGAYVQLGLKSGAPFDQIEGVLVNARAYTFSTKARIDKVQRLVSFFTARAKLGSMEARIADIRKAYHRMAMNLHPDRNTGDRQSEDALKAINEAYALIEEIHREARDYFRYNEQYRRETEDEAPRNHRAQAGRTEARLAPGAQPRHASSAAPRSCPTCRGRKEIHGRIGSAQYPQHAFKPYSHKPRHR